jgi:phosphoribosyl-AMP cyclohydrolase
MNLDFQKSDGLVTAVVQDHVTGRVLMVGYMNEEAFRKTVETGFTTFYSRSRRKLSMKGDGGSRGERHIGRLFYLRSSSAARICVAERSHARPRSVADLPSSSLTF